MKTKAASQQAALKRRIRQFYRLLNSGDWDRCYRMIDPLLLAQPSTITLLQYTACARHFLDAVGKVDVQTIHITGLHLDEPNRLYQDRDFAIGTTIWVDRIGVTYTFSERWVREGTAWYTRSTGFLKPSATNGKNGTRSKARQNRGSS